MNDKLGKEIVVGCYLAYGHLLGRRAGLRIGKVLEVKTVRAEYYGNSTARITVIGIDDDWSREGIKLCSRQGTLQFPKRTIVLDPQSVPAHYKELLDGYHD
jgi:hypothetical protein